MVQMGSPWSSSSRAKWLRYLTGCPGLNTTGLPWTSVSFSAVVKASLASRVSPDRT